MGEGLRLVYSKSDLDDAFKDKRFGENIRVELLFETLEDYNACESSVCVGGGGGGEHVCVGGVCVRKLR